MPVKKEINMCSMKNRDAFLKGKIKERIMNDDIKIAEKVLDGARKGKMPSDKEIEDGLKKGGKAGKIWEKILGLKLKNTTDECDGEIKIL